jgi:purine-nucleoside phosphorylase
MSRSAELADLIRERAGSAPVHLGLILGSGLAHLADAVEGTAID